jgi:Zn finger protein HypA/HybF involved in hydrogenase expression
MSEEEKRGIYCPHCLLYGLAEKPADEELPDEEEPRCPECGGRAQWEDEVTVPVREAVEAGRVGWETIQVRGGEASRYG